jgi:hypothetical protein
VAEGSFTKGIVGLVGTPSRTVEFPLNHLLRNLCWNLNRLIKNNQRDIGIMFDCWNVGILEYWGIGSAEKNMEKRRLGNPEK